MKYFLFVFDKNDPENSVTTVDCDSLGTEKQSY